ncbi:Hypothetical protein SMAX5B_010406 [Scophthalmus maximus]|uniref:Uncharacterized protein n=1 Tax=Scophthalmus maximus TaxID=52904 RepID=A0A2U9BUH9_SCOMX|nr:Hypothetical protein SMAX5B_010406 [Scophthalmus maximus]
MALGAKESVRFQELGLHCRNKQHRNQAAGAARPANRNKEVGKRDRQKEGWSDRKRREREHISRPFSVTFVLSWRRATMNINMNP